VSDTVLDSTNTFDSMCLHDARSLSKSDLITRVAERLSNEKNSTHIISPLGCAAPGV
jgi:hypothetical protein